MAVSPEEYRETIDRLLRIADDHRKIISHQQRQIRQLEDAVSKLESIIRDYQSMLIDQSVTKKPNP